jgi:hypothetical protein
MSKSSLQQAFDAFIFAVDEDLKRDTAIKLAEELGVEFDSLDYDLP